MGCGFQMGLLYNNNCTCNVSKCKIPKITVRVQSQNTGSKLGVVWDPNRAGSKLGYFTLTSICNKSIVPSK